MRAFERQRGLGAIDDDRVFADDPALREDPVVKRDGQIVGRVLELDFERVALDLVGNVFEDQIAHAVGQRDLKARFEVAATAPAGELLRGGVGAEVERRPFRVRARGGEIGVPPEALAPVEGLEFVVLVDPDYVRDRARLQMPQFFFGIADFTESGRGQHEAHQEG